MAKAFKSHARASDVSWTYYFQVFLGIIVATSKEI